MRTYTADHAHGKKLWNERRRKHPSYRIGLIVLACALIAIVVFDAHLLSRAENPAQMPEILLLCLGVDILPGIVAAIAIAAMRSGGREVLMGRTAETCTLENDRLVLEYIPHKGAEERYDRIRHTFRYQDIRSIDVEDGYRVTLEGAHDISKFYTADGVAHEDRTSTTFPLAIIAYYPEFNELVRDLRSHIDRP